MVLEIQDNDTLELAAIKYIFSELVFAPVDALLEFASTGKLSMLAAYSATLSIINSVPEFIARCHGEKGSAPTISKWKLNGKKYLYVYGIFKLDLISEAMMVTPYFEDHAGFLYDRLRGDIAHSIVSRKLQFYKDMQGDYLGGFSYYASDTEKGDSHNNLRKIAGFNCYLPNIYRKMREGVEQYIAKIESGEEELHLQNAQADFVHIPGISGFLEQEFGFLGLLDKIHEYFPESNPSR